jgi:hypothetical protein
MKSYLTPMLSLAFLISSLPALASTKVIVSIENLSQPSNFEAELPNTAPTAFPLFYAFHEGSIDLFDEGALARPTLAALAKEGIIIPLIQETRTQHPTATVNMVTNNFSGPDSAVQFTNYLARAQVLDPELHRFFSFAAKLAPSDDAFIGNDDPLDVRVFDNDGRFLGPIVIDVYGHEVWDAGARVNNETDVLYVALREPDLSRGTSSSEPIAKHPGFNGSDGNPSGQPVGILGVVGGGCSFSRQSLSCFQLDPEAGDFSRPNYPIARIRITERIDASLSGLWNSPVLSGEGYTLIISGSPQTLSVGGYSYLPDGSGKQVWLFGNAPTSEFGGVVPLFTTSGGSFASPQNPANVQVQPWGEFYITFVSCDEVLIRLLPISPEYTGLGENRLIYLYRTLGLINTGLERTCYSPVFLRDPPDNSWPDFINDVIEPQP